MGWQWMSAQDKHIYINKLSFVTIYYQLWIQDVSPQLCDTSIRVHQILLGTSVFLTSFQS